MIAGSSSTMRMVGGPLEMRRAERLRRGRRSLCRGRACRQLDHLALEGGEHVERASGVGHPRAGQIDEPIHRVVGTQRVVVEQRQPLRPGGDREVHDPLDGAVSPAHPLSGTPRACTARRGSRDRRRRGTRCAADPRGAPRRQCCRPGADTASAARDRSRTRRRRRRPRGGSRASIAGVIEISGGDADAARARRRPRPGRGSGSWRRAGRASPGSRRTASARRASSRAAGPRPCGA